MPISAEQLQRMHAGRERQRLAQRDQDHRDVAAYRTWCRTEANAARNVQVLTDELGFDHATTRDARRQATLLRLAMPRLVPDSSPAWGA